MPCHVTFTRLHEIHHRSLFYDNHTQLFLLFVGTLVQLFIGLTVRLVSIGQKIVIQTDITKILPSFGKPISCPFTVSYS